MNEAFWTHTFEILAMLLVASLLGVLLGYIIWYKWRRMFLDLQREHDRLHALHLDLEKDHASLRYKAEELEKSDRVHRQRVMGLEGDVAVLKGKLAKCEEKLSSGGSTKMDDLKKIEGIGPKIEKLCHDIGVYTWAQLAGTPVDKLRKMLDEAGPRYRIANPDTWPKQAEMAANGQWRELKVYQDELSGGRKPVK